MRGSPKGNALHEGPQVSAHVGSAVDRLEPLAAPHPNPLPVALGTFVARSTDVDGPRAAGRGGPSPCPWSTPCQAWRGWPRYPTMMCNADCFAMPCTVCCGRIIHAQYPAQTAAEHDRRRFPRLAGGRDGPQVPAASTGRCASCRPAARRTAVIQANLIYELRRHFREQKIRCRVGTEVRRHYPRGRRYHRARAR